MTVSVTMKDLLDSGVHYGHQTRRWNPKMKPYIFGTRNGIHIIDIQKTVHLMKKAFDFLENVTASGGHVLFVGTKRSAQDAMREEAERSSQFFINHRWLGGTLTNFPTIRQSIHRLKRMEKIRDDGTVAKLTKKEALDLTREIEKLEKTLGGIKNMPGIPKALFILDSHHEHIAVKEAKRLGIPVIAITDTNADPTDIDYPIPGNDDSLKAISLFARCAAEACLAGKSRAKDFIAEDAKSGGRVSTGVFKDDTGHKVAVEKKTSFTRDEEDEEEKTIEV